MSAKTALTYGMTKGWRLLPLNVAIRVRAKIKRAGPPEVGKCFYDEAGRLIYIVSGCYLDPQYGRLSNHWHWRRVFTDGSLSAHEYSGYWKWGNAGQHPGPGTRGKASRPKKMEKRVRDPLKTIKVRMDR